MEEWYAVQSKPRQEFLACHALTSIAGVRTFFTCSPGQAYQPTGSQDAPLFPRLSFRAR